MASQHLPFLAATAFAAILLNFFLKRRSSDISGGEADNEAAANDGTARSTSSTHTSREGHGLVNSSSYDSEVFLSFKGPYAGATFVDFFYTNLINAGIRAFKDDEDLRNGEELRPELLQAIYQSKILIPIFSKGYASSVWCLKELVQMVECQKTRARKIIPIFYDVTPLEVRHQTGDYGEAFLSHENKKCYDEETMRVWKAALNEVSFLKGWELHNLPNRRQDESARELTQKVFSELKKKNPCFVSVDHHVNRIMEMIGAHTSETRTIGIHGMGGIGKTTIAKIVYNQLSHDFEDCCFLPNIRETSRGNGIPYLQNQLISDILNTECTNIKDIDEGTQTIKDKLSNKRVLLLLDDVMETTHIDALVGKCDWLGRGSRIIITTRNKSVLYGIEVDCCYVLCGMDRNQSIQLFSQHAFRRDSPLNEYIDQTNMLIDMAKGVPLLLEVIGSLLSGKGKEMWEDILRKLENISPFKIRDFLKIIYDGLDIREKCIFLDIACLFIGYDKDILVHFWNASHHFSIVAMEVLQDMSLIKINEDNRVWMHDHLRDLGRYIVRQESNCIIEKQSRVWNHEEALDLLRRHTVKNVRALHLKFDHEGSYHFTYEGFMGLSNLRFLKLDGSKENFSAEERLFWHESPSNILPTNVFRENSYLLPQLQWLSWHDIPPTFKIIFSMENMVILDLSQSDIMDDWNGWSHIKVIKNLKVLNLTGCCCLERTPSFPAQANIERLILRGCSKLVEIDRSICHLKCLVSLDVRYCRRLRRLPNKLGGLASLEELLIDYCSLIEEIPHCQGLRNLRIFTASRCPIITLPLSTGELANLEYLSLGDCRSLKRLPNSIGNLKSLIELDISGTRIEELPDSIENLKNLKIVNMTGSSISKIPDALWKIETLEEIEAVGELPFYVKIGSYISRNQFLRILRLRHAEIYAVPRLPESLIILELHRLHMNTFPDLSNLINLKNLQLWFEPRDSDGKSHGPVEEDQLPWWIRNLSKLESLNLRSDHVTTLPTDIFILRQLESLELRCSNLRCLPKLPLGLLSLRLCDCVSLCLMDLSNLGGLSSLEIQGSSISEIQDLDCLKNLKSLSISGLGQVEILPDLRNLNKLIFLAVDRCCDLIEIQGELPHSLEVLEIFSCKSLKKLPHLSSLRGLQKVTINDCMELNVEAILSFARRSQANLWEMSENKCTLHLKAS